VEEEETVVVISGRRAGIPEDWSRRFAGGVSMPVASGMAVGGLLMLAGTAGAGGGEKIVPGLSHRLGAETLVPVSLILPQSSL